MKKIEFTEKEAQTENLENKRLNIALILNCNIFLNKFNFYK